MECASASLQIVQRRLSLEKLRKQRMDGDLPSWIPQARSNSTWRFLYPEEYKHAVKDTQDTHINCKLADSSNIVHSIFFGIEIILTERTSKKNVLLARCCYISFQWLNSLLTGYEMMFPFRKGRCSNLKYPSKWIDTTEIRATATILVRIVVFSRLPLFVPIPTSGCWITNELSRSTLVAAAIKRILFSVWHRIRKKQDLIQLFHTKIVQGWA